MFVFLLSMAWIGFLAQHSLKKYTGEKIAKKSKTTKNKLCYEPGVWYELNAIINPKITY